MISEKKIKEAADNYGLEYYNSSKILDYPDHFIAGVQWAIDQMSFKKPSFEEIRAEFIYKNGTHELAEQFWNHYEANNWMVGKVKMKRWPNAVAQWVSREKKKYNGQSNKGGLDELASLAQSVLHGDRR